MSFSKPERRKSHLMNRKWISFRGLHVSIRLDVYPRGYDYNFKDLIELLLGSFHN